MKRRFTVIAAAAAALGTLSVGSAASQTLTSQRLTPMTTCIVTATPNPTASVADAYVNQNAAGTNSGGAATLTVQPAGSTSVARRAYLRFDLTTCSPVIPASATVRLATLRLNISTIPASLCETLDVFAVASAWTELGVTWTNQPAGTTINVPASASRTASAPFGAAGSCPGSYSAGYGSWVVTTDVAKWVAGSATNNGWMIRNDVEALPGTASDLVAFIAKESALPARAPQLIITYVP